MDHRSSAREILSAIGGKENLVSAAHCATRLRLIIADNSKIQRIPWRTSMLLRAFLKLQDSFRSS